MSLMAYNKNQHTVQKAYLSQWEIDDDFFVYDLNKKKLYDKNSPKTIFREEYIYNWNDFEGRDRYLIDDIFTDIENQGFPVIQKILNNPINGDEKQLLSLYVALQTIRTPKMRDYMHELTLAISKNGLIEQLKDSKKKIALLNEMPKESHEFINNIASDPEKNVNDLFNNKFIFNIKNIREIWLQSSLTVLKDLAQSNFHAHWFLFQAGKRRSFITSDNPVTTISQINASCKATKENVNFTQVTFPLSPKFLLLIHKDHRKTSSHKVYKTKRMECSDSVREFNWRTATYADRYIVSHSDKLLLKISEITYPDWVNIRHNKERFEDSSKGFIHGFKTENKSIKLLKRIY